MTFRFSVDIHLWVILTDPRAYPDQVVCVNFTSDGDDTCLVQRSEHSGLTHDSCIGYRFGRFFTLDQLLEFKDSGLLRLEPDQATPALLKRIRQSAGNAPTMDDEVVDALISQGYIDLNI